jgi:hypothetical protein
MSDRVALETLAGRRGLALGAPGIPSCIWAALAHL